MIAKETKRYILKNINTPTKSNISEAEEAELEEFLHNAKLIIGTLGHKAFDPLLEEKEQQDNSDVLYLSFSSRDGIKGKARGKRTNEGFVLLKGSRVNSAITASMPKCSLKLREKHSAIIDENFIVTDDILFSAHPVRLALFAGGHQTV